jgi:SBP domain
MSQQVADELLTGRIGDHDCSGDDSSRVAHWPAHHYTWDAIGMRLGPTHHCDTETVGVSNSSSSPPASSVGTVAPAVTLGAPGSATSSAAGRRGQRAAAAAAMQQLAGHQRQGSKRGSELVCQVPECGVRLANAREYHQRYRICVQHARVSEW